MIKPALAFLQSELNQYINRKTDYTDIVKLSAIVDQQGNMLLPVDSVAMTLVNVDEERVAKAQNPFQRNPLSGEVTKKNPVIRLNLFVLFTAYPQITADHSPNNYDQSLEKLSQVITFFQGHSYFGLAAPGGGALLPAHRAAQLPLGRHRHQVHAFGAVSRALAHGGRH